MFVLHFYVAKGVLSSVSPQILGGFRGFLGGLVILLFQYRKIDFKFQHKFLSTYVVIAFFGFFINQILFLNGLKMSTPLNTSIIMNTIPLMTALIAMVFKIEIFRWMKLGGVILGFSMVTILALHSRAGQLNTNQFGDLYIFLSVLCLCVATNISKTLFKKGGDPTLNSGTMLLFGGLALLIVGIADFVPMLEFTFSSPENFGKILFEVFFSTALTYYLSFQALKYLAPSQSMIFIYTQPIMTSTIDYFVYDKNIDLTILFIFIGILVSGYLVLTSTPD
ncbi:DMT family transporter [bacterium]|nr:DMT family transporter [bacterium]